jgi:type 1 glutamine amidotransferase/nicotinamidase-related amidase
MSKSLMLTALVLSAAVAGPIAAADDGAMLTLVGRQRIKQEDGTYRVQLAPLTWDARQTAIVICDMWDGHYCRASEARVAEMAPHMNEVITVARQRGVLIIHSPSGCMDKYEGMPQRKLAQSAPPVESKAPLEKWCYLNKAHEGDLPIDDSVPCEDADPRPAVRMFSQQHEAIQIAAEDAITDSVEAYYLLRQRGIKNLIVMGVHTNMCVLGRPFGIRQMVRQGINVALMRDMTDSMYNPAMKPLVSHFRGTELVIEHIEKHWCPTLTSTDFTGRSAFRFREDARPRVDLIIGGKEHDCDESLANLAHMLRDQHGYYVEEHVGRGEGAAYSIPGLDALTQSDVCVLYLRRRALPAEQLKRIKDYLAAGKPLIALRPASHGFDPQEEVPLGLATWPEFDREVLGCKYQGHTTPDLGTEVAVAAESKENPLLEGVDLSPWHSSSWLYSSKLMDTSATVLLTGAVRDNDGTLINPEPIAWTRTYQAPGGKPARIYYTSLGHKNDFATPAFQRLLVNALAWAIDRKSP